jgi:formylglycine-generating enzyme required for sulfatase activity
MAGNVNEWVLDDFVAENQPVDIELLPRRKNAGVDEKRVTTSKVIKGGGYLDAPYFLTLGSRRAMAPTEQRADLGFRIVMTISSSSGSNAY